MIWNRDKGEHLDTDRDTGEHLDTNRDTRTHADDADNRTAYDGPEDRAADVQQAREEKWGGMHLGAGFFGWLVAVGMAVLLSSIIGAIAAAVGDANDVTQSQLDREAGKISVAAAIVLLVVLLISFYAGGYVAGRMSRFDGARQGWAVWLISLVTVAIAAIIGAVYGAQYDVMNRVDIPNVPIPTEDLTLGGAVTIAAAIFATLLAALAGGKAGTHYHSKIDRTW
jgi:hypothetical protein